MSVVPDFIDVQQGWRTWKIANGRLDSVSFRTTWEPGEPIAATCKVSSKPKAWQAVPMADAVESGELMAQDWKEKAYDEDDGAGVPRPPRVVLPFTNAYIYAEEPPHQSPSESCKCGIYAAHTPDQCAGYGKYVLGRVNLWGTVIPGEKGYRAEFAYPSELFVLTEPIEESRSSYMVMFSFQMQQEEARPTDKQVRALEAYGVPVRRVATWREALDSVEAVAA